MVRTAAKQTEAISIHALRGEGDGEFKDLCPMCMISIHALRGEGDLRRSITSKVEGLISIHALRGEGDQQFAADFGMTVSFQSTPSVGRATTPLLQHIYYKNISIHALRGEGDSDNSN